MNDLPVPAPQPPAHTPFAQRMESPDLAPGFPRRPGNNEADALTPAQQKAVVAIVEKWWGFKMASIETGKVLELSDKLDYIIAHHGLPNPTSAEVQAWRGKNPRR